MEHRRQRDEEHQREGHIGERAAGEDDVELTEGNQRRRRRGRCRSEPSATHPPDHGNRQAADDGIDDKGTPRRIDTQQVEQGNQRDIHRGRKLLLIGEHPERLRRIRQSQSGERVHAFVEVRERGIAEMPGAECKPQRGEHADHEKLDSGHGLISR